VKEVLGGPTFAHQNSKFGSPGVIFVPFKYTMICLNCSDILC